MSEGHTRPTPEQLAPLEPFERWAFEACDFANSNPAAKKLGGAFLEAVGKRWVYYATRNLVHLVGFDRLTEFRPDRGVIIASNHRSLFDQYLIACWLYQTSDLMRRIYFPVRSEFFYERPQGVLVNLLMSALAMYPPVFRDPKKRAFNNYGLKRLVELLQSPESVVGVHPEGTRGKGSDPYALQPAQPGIGKLIISAKPHVVPFFVNGLGNDLPRQVRSNFDRTGEPIIIVAGAPLDLSDFFERRNTLRVQKELADHVLARIAELGEIERTLRRRLAGRVPHGPVMHSLESLE